MTLVADFEPQVLDLHLYQGDTASFTLRIGWLDELDVKHYIDLTGVTPVAQIRKSRTSTTPVATFDCTILDQTDPDLKGGVRLVLPATEAENLRFNCVWDLEFTFPGVDGVVRTYVTGAVVVEKDVTRD